MSARARVRVPHRARVRAVSARAHVRVSLQFADEEAEG